MEDGGQQAPALGKAGGQGDRGASTVALSATVQAALSAEALSMFGAVQEQLGQVHLALTHIERKLDLQNKNKSMIMS